VRKNGKDVQVRAIWSQLDVIKQRIGDRKPSLGHTPGLIGPKGAIAVAMDKAQKAGTIIHDDMINTLAKGIARDLSRNENVRFAFSVSTAEQYKNELVAALEAQGAPKDDESIREIAHLAYEQGVASACGIQLGECEYKPDTENSRYTGQNRVSEVGSFTMGGIRYEPTQQYGHDSSPSVVTRFEPVGGGTPVILKLLRAEQTGTTKAGDIQEMTNEAAMLRHMHHSSPEHAGRLENVLRLPDGRLALVMEYEPNGDVHGLMRKLATDKSIYLGQAKTIRCTLARDILEAAAAMEEAGINHSDIKGPNFMINAKGKARLADFGTARFGALRKMTKRFQNMTWNAPEARLQADALPKADAAKAAAIKSKFKAQIEKLEDDFKNQLDVQFKGQKGSKASLARDALLNRFEREHLAPLRAQAKQAEQAALPSFNLDAKAGDRWSLGTVLWEIYSGTALFDIDHATMTKWGCKTAEAATDMAHDQFLAMSPGAKAKFLFGRPGLEVPPDIQDVILSLLENDPAKRMSPRDALTKGVFNDISVGSKAVRTLLIDVAKGKSPAKA
jgi:serine/threonine protein kinase